jgi:peptidoglycan/xylan/chitin deacetylase (PgdA/CDA1 family)
MKKEHTVAEGWLPPGKSAAVCFTIDDVHPGRSTDAYEAGGDLDRGVLGHVERLLERHPAAKVTLFTTADWREISPSIERTLLARLPVVRDRVMLARTLPAGTMRLDRHPDFVRWLSHRPRMEVGLHGLHHIHVGRSIHVEFQEQSRRECARMLREALHVFDAAGLRHARGMCPPGWNAPPALLQAMVDVGLRFVASARDIRTPIAQDALTAMSGIQGVPLLYPAWLQDGQLVHFATNFQATSPIERALGILDNGGLLAIKGHAIKNAMGFVALDGVDGVYTNFLDLLFSELDRRYGESLWWTTMGEIAERLFSRDERFTDVREAVHGRP